MFRYRHYFLTVLLLGIHVPKLAFSVDPESSWAAYGNRFGQNPLRYYHHRAAQPLDDEEAYTRRQARQAQRNIFNDPAKSIAGSFVRLAHASDAVAVSESESEERAQGSVSVCFGKLHRVNGELEVQIRAGIRKDFFVILFLAENCSQCADMYGNMFEVETCG